MTCGGRRAEGQGTDGEQLAVSEGTGGGRRAEASEETGGGQRAAGRGERRGMNTRAGRLGEMGEGRWWRAPTKQGWRGCSFEGIGEEEKDECDRATERSVPVDDERRQTRPSDHRVRGGSRRCALRGEKGGDSRSEGTPTEDHMRGRHAEARHRRDGTTCAAERGGGGSLSRQ